MSKSKAHLIFWLLSTFLLLAYLFADKAVVEAWHAHFFHSLVSTGNFLFSGIEFPVGQLLFFLLAGYLLYLLRELWVNRMKPVRTLHQLGMYFMILVLLFGWSWGLNYRTDGIENKLNLQPVDEDPNMDELHQMAEYFLLKSNELSSHFHFQSPPDMKEMRRLSHHSWNQFAVANKQFPIFDQPNTKYAIFPDMMSYAGLGGIYFPFTAEANVNPNLPWHKLPFTLCHEMAHQRGVAREDEANFMAFLVCEQSPDTALQFSANELALRYCLSYLDSASQARFTNRASLELHSRWLESKAYREHYQSWLADLSSGINHIFLKANGEEEGIRSYGQVMQWLRAWYRQRTTTISASKE